MFFKTTSRFTGQRCWTLSWNPFWPRWNPPPKNPLGGGGFLEEKSLGNFQQKEWNHGGFQWDFRFKRSSNVVFRVEKLCFYSYGFNGSLMLVQDDFIWFQEFNECSKGIFSLGIYKKPSKLGIEWVFPRQNYPIWWVGVFLLLVGPRMGDI